MSGIITDNVGRTSGLIKSAGGGGKIGQVVQTLMTDTASTTSTTFVTTGFEVAITPVADSSKILLYVNFGSVGNRYEVTYYTHLKIVGGNCATYIGDAATGIETAIAYQAQGGSAGLDQAPCSMMYLDSPSTTSETTYTVHWMQTSGGLATINRSNGTGANGGNSASTIIAMEVLA
tara:strand:- start:654 stop:1181 length:528 start_codon:yes stop_codon:yes gene_type:complete